MKLDGESACCQPTLAQNPDSKIVEFNNIVNDTDALEPGEKLIKEIQNEVSCGLKGNEGDVNCLSSQINRSGLWNISEFDCSTSDDSTNANEDEVRDSGEPLSHSSSQEGLYQKDMELYDAKSVMDELPEIIVCYKESHDNVIKDICIDQGVTSLGKILFGDCVDGGKSLRDFLLPVEDKAASLVKGHIDNTMSTPEDLKPSPEKDDCKDSANQCASMDQVHIDLSHNNVAEAKEDKHVPGSIEPDGHLETEDSEPDLSVDIENGVNKLSVQILNEEAMSKNSTLVSAVKESSSSFNKLTLASAVEESNTTLAAIANDVAYDSKVEGGSITFNFDSSAPASGSKEESSQNGDFGNLATLNVSKDGISDSQTVPDQIRHSPGESSFSMAGPGGASFSITGPLSGLITYSGPIAYSGSCSVRSDSSTTSTRSFAFPVLQAEWNSSPVRMRKADRRKHRCWREGLLCCRF